MRSKPFCLVFLALCALQPAFAAESDSFWPQWRGPIGSGAAPQADPPLNWSESSNVKWKTAIPGKGTSTPVIWGDRVFILTAIPTGRKQEKATEATNSAAAATTSTNAPPARNRFRPEAPSEFYQFVTLCLDRKTGKVLWEKIACEEVPHEGHHQDHSFASGSPVTDGKHVYAFFGSRGLYCYDFDGKLKWEKRFGKMQTRNGFGEGTSPALYGDVIVVNWDDETDKDFIAAFDKTTGKELWRKPRNEGTGWATPLVVEYKGKPQVVVNAAKRVRSYDLATGEQIWECGGQTDNPIPTPVADKDTVYAISGFRGAFAAAIELGHTGDLTDNTNAIRWTYNKNMPYVPSPLLVDGLIYTFAVNNPILSCFDAKTGKPHYEAERLEGIFSVYASPVSAKDRVYILGREGVCLVLKKSTKLEVIATNKIDDKGEASLALAGNDLFIRGRQNLYCIAEK